MRRTSSYLCVRGRSVCLASRCRRATFPPQCNHALDYGVPEMMSRDRDLKFKDYDGLLSDAVKFRSLRGGQCVQAHMIKTFYLPSLFLRHKLISFYLKLESLNDARLVFEEMPERNVVSWTAIISGYSKNGASFEALGLFIQMLRSGIDPNAYTFATVLASCAGASVLGFGIQVHGLAVKTPFELHMYVGCSLLDLYAKSGRIYDARQVFDAMPLKDVVCYTSIISGYAQLGLDREALGVFRALHGQGITSNYVTYAIVLTTLSGIASYDYGRQVHGHALRFEQFHVILENSLIDMYSKCGNLESARKVFDTMPERTVVSWNTMLAGYSKHGDGKALLDLYNMMKVGSNGINPDSVTLLTVLSGCSHGGMEKIGLEVFDEMTAKYELQLGVEHFGCVVDLLSRAGQLEKALLFIKEMPVEPNAAIWSSLLGACTVHRNISVGKVAGEKLLEIEPDVAGHYINLCNLYSGDGRWEEVKKVRRLMQDRGVLKKPGSCWIQFGRNSHSNDASNQTA